MKKLFLGIVAMILMLAIMIPTVNAATISPDKTEMKVGEIVTITLRTDDDVEYIQFDLKFDNTKFEYMNDSAKSTLNSTGSNLTSKDVVTVSAFDLNGATTKEISLQFKAISTGEHVPFKVEGTIEIGKNGELIEQPEIEVAKIEEGPYVDENGNVITELPKTGTIIMIPVICAVVVLIVVFVVKASKPKKVNNRRYK
ncbi:MAG: hypothetical protein HFJ48_03070 [Clostridia bacterium]|nr:hypothetical protein [Clostridia bacterium]